MLKIEHGKKVEQLRKMEVKRADYMKTEKAKKEVEKLESRMMVSSTAIESTSHEIVKLREEELYPQLVELVKGLVYIMLIHGTSFHCRSKPTQTKCFAFDTEPIGLVWLVRFDNGSFSVLCILMNIQEIESNSHSTHSNWSPSHFSLTFTQISPHWQFLGP